MAINQALIGKAGETLVAAELLRRGVEVAYPASDVGTDLLAYRLQPKQTVAGNFVPILVKERSARGYYFSKSEFEPAPGMILVHVWFVAQVPQFYVFRDLGDVKAALDVHAKSESWMAQGGYGVTDPTDRHVAVMQPHRDQWNRVIDRLFQAGVAGAPA